MMKPEDRNVLCPGSVVCLVLILLLACIDANAGEVTLLSSGSTWKKQYVFFPPRVSEKAAKAAGLPTDSASRSKLIEKRVPGGFRTDNLPPTWKQVTFDDYEWHSAYGVTFSKSGWGIKPGWDLKYCHATDPFVPGIGLMAMRGKFIINDASKVKKLNLSLTYRGGFIAYLNGEEIARGSLPKGKIEFDTPSDDYPKEAFFIEAKGKKKPLHWFNNRQAEFQPLWAKRSRKSGNIEIDPKKLVNGVNVLALELHRSDYLVECKSKSVGLCFATIGLSEFFLKAETGKANVVSACERPDSFQVWNAETWQSVSDTDFGNPSEGLKTVRIAGTRNGTFAGQVVASSTAPIMNLKVVKTALTGSGGKIDPENIKIMYGAPNPLHGAQFSWYTGLSSRRLDLLLDKAPSEVKTGEKPKPSKAYTMFRNAFGLPMEPKPGAVIPVWILVRIPADAKAGRYNGSITISAKDAKPVRVALALNVSDWSLPDVKNFTPPIFIYQSPESLARLYKVKMWSEEHWKLIESSLKLLGEFGNGGLIFSVMAETCMGNPEGMVTWLKQKDGSYKHDFSIFDRYLETAMKYHSVERLKVAGVNVWGYEVRLDKGKTESRRKGKITVRDESGAKSNILLPEYGTPECEAIWRPVLLAIKEKLKKYKIEHRMMFGLGGDISPSGKQVAMFDKILPGTPWFRESHFPAHKFNMEGGDKKSAPVGCTSMVWGGSIPDPAEKRLYGWKYNPANIRLSFNRYGTQCLVLKGFPPPWSFRMWMESTITCGRNGNGRVGGDFFPLGIDLRKLWKGRKVSSEAGGGSGGTLFASYPDSQVGQIGLGNSTTDLLGAGEDGPVTTVRFENARLSNQEAEARIFIEKAILAKSLPADLAQECQKHLDARANALRMWALNTGKIALGSFAWRLSNKKLFDLAGQVAKAIRK